MSINYKKLDEKLSSLIKKMPNIIFDIDDVNNQNDIKNIKKILNRVGVVILSNVMDKSQIKNLLSDIKKCSIDMFGEHITSEDKEKIKKDIYNLNPYRNTKNGFGNASFSYFFKQPANKSSTPFINMNNEQVYFTHNYSYRVNINLLESNKHLSSTLMALTHPIGGMVSYDSFKVANYPTPKPKEMTKQLLTKPHIDIYNRDNIDRYQSLFLLESNVKLGFVPFTSTKSIKNMIGELYDSEGFKIINDIKLMEIMDKYVIAAPTNSVIIWNSGIIHYEASFTNKSSGLQKLTSREITKNSPLIRCCIGTHKHTFSNMEILKLAYCAHNGVMPEVYHNYNKGNVGKNIVSKKSTRYLVNRIISEKEKNYMNTILNKIDNKSEEELWALCDNEISLFGQYLHGIPVDMAKLKLDERDKKILKIEF